MQFNRNYPQPLNFDNLFLIQPKEGESLHDYIACFNMTMLEVHNLNEKVAMSALKRGLWNNYFLFSLDKSFSKDYIDLLTHAWKYAQVEEAVAIHQ